MALVIRLRQQGRKNHRSFRVVVADERYPRDGKYIEKLGWYDPHLENDKNLQVDVERLKHWIENGARVSERSQSILKKAAPEVIKQAIAKSKQKSK